MLTEYSDILEAVGQMRVQWWDQKGVPRFCSYHPNHTAPYYDISALLNTTCQACGIQFKYNINLHKEPNDSIEKIAIRLHNKIGDPPIHYIGSDRCVGNTMLMEVGDVLIRQLWIADKHFNWRREVRTMYIANVRLQEGVHEGRKVVYKVGTREEQRGVISSWNSTYVFVKYNNNTQAQGTKVEYLSWTT